MSEIIYLAKPNKDIETTYAGYTKFYEVFSAQLQHFHEVRPLDLPDIWVRDFLPVQNVKTGQLYQTFFDPRYANYTPKFTEQIRQAVKYYFPQAKPCDVRIDGGNIILSPDKKSAFCMEKQTIFKKSDFAQKIYAEHELKQALGVEEILWIPHQQGDKIGHIDGYFQFLGDNLMEGAVELYGGITTGSLLDYNGTDILYQYCKGKGVLQYEHYLPEKVSSYIVYLICKPAEEDYLDANGLYVNFLETSKAVFVPQFGLSEDKKVIDIIVKFTSKPVIPIDCRQIAKYGGAVHCLTREYI